MKPKFGDAIIMTGHVLSGMPSELIGCIFIVISSTETERYKCRGLSYDTNHHRIWYIHPKEMRII